MEQSPNGAHQPLVSLCLPGQAAGASALRTLDALLANPLLTRFVAEVERLHHPELRFRDWCAALRAAIAAGDAQTGP